MRRIPPSAYSFLLALVSAATAAIGQTTTRVSVTASGAQLPNPSVWGAISGDGRYAAFVSLDALLPSDTNNTTDVYVRELATGVVRRVSVTPAGVQPNDACFDPVLSDDGRFIAFGSWATNLAPSDNNGAMGNDIFVRDMQTGALQHVSKNAAGAGGNGISAYHDMSGNGRFVTFYSYSTNLVPNDPDTSQDTYLVDRTTGQIQCLSVDPVSGQAAGGGEASLSDDGRFVAFKTWAPLFGAPATTIALLDRQTGSVVCVPLQGGQPMHAFGAQMSGDGRTVLFESPFSFDPLDTDFFADVYSYDVATATRRLVSVAPSPGLTAACSLAAASDDARYVVFTTEDSYLPVDTNTFFDSYVIDTATNSLELVTRGNGGQSGNDTARVAGMSDNGRRCVFGSGATNLVPNDTNSALDVFVRDRAVAAGQVAYGAGLAGTGGLVPGIALLGEPVIGTAPVLGVANNTGAPAGVVVVLGMNPVSLPTPLLGTLLVSPDATSLVITPAPALLLPIPIPDQFSLNGVHVYLQALVLDPGAPAGVAFTRGLDLTIGG
ncbi:MAG TPA: hypothetical protein VF384_17305 [Planctomycetota bacterium]